MRPGRPDRGFKTGIELVNNRNSAICASLKSQQLCRLVTLRRKNMSLLPANVHQSWKDFLSSDILNMLEYIENQLVEDFSPDRQKVLRFLETDQRSLKIVILGQDPSEKDRPRF